MVPKSQKKRHSDVGWCSSLISSLADSLWPATCTACIPTSSMVRHDTYWAYLSVCLSVCLSVFPFVCLSLFCILYYFHSSFWKGKVYLDIRINSRSRWGLSPTNIRINFASPETRMTVLPDAENSTIVSSFYWTKHRNVTDRRTDGQTARAVTAVCIATNSDAL